MPAPLLAIPAIPVWAVAIVAAIALALGIGILAAWYFYRANRVVILSGMADAGKTTLLDILRGKGFSRQEPTDKAVGDSVLIRFGDKKYFFHDTSGSVSANATKSNFRKTLFEESKKHKKPFLNLYVFNAKKYEEERINIMAAKKETDGRESEIDVGSLFSKKEIPYKAAFLAIGTRAKELSDKKKGAIKKELDEKGIRCYLLELSENPKGELEKIIGGADWTRIE